MKLMISGSMTFVHDMILLQKKLETLGHIVCLPIGIEPHLKDPSYQDDLDKNTPELIKEDIMLRNFKQIEVQDGIIILNKKKNGIDGYMGTSMLMEMAIAHFLEKKIFVMHNIPHYNTHRWAHEVTIMQPVFINEDLKKIM